MKRCILAATHLINLSPSAVIELKTPYERLMNKKPGYKQLRVIGCFCYASKDGNKVDKYEEKEIRSNLIGYTYAQKRYKLYDLEKRRISVSGNVVFKEEIFPLLDLNPSKEKDSLKLTLNSMPICSFNLMQVSKPYYLLPAKQEEEDGKMIEHVQYRA